MLKISRTNQEGIINTRILIFGKILGRVSDRESFSTHSYRFYRFTVSMRLNICTHTHTFCYVWMCYLRPYVSWLFTPVLFNLFVVKCLAQGQAVGSTYLWSNLVLMFNQTNLVTIKSKVLTTAYFIMPHQKVEWGGF